MINTYIINLKESYARRENIASVLNPYVYFLNLIFVDAFDGRNMQHEELEAIFQQNKAFKIYGRKLIGPEVGCTMSHRQCLSRLVDSQQEACLIFEDDLVLPVNDISSELTSIYRYTASASRPTIVLLSGDYWYTSKKTIQQSTRLAKVREAVCSHAYFINRSAAEIILSEKPYTLADDWYSIRNKGIMIYAAYPHLADQNRRDLDTEISEDYTGFIRRNLSLSDKIKSYVRAVIKRMLVYTNHFEPKSFLQ